MDGRDGYIFCLLRNSLTSSVMVSNELFEHETSKCDSDLSLQNGQGTMLIDDMARKLEDDDMERGHRRQLCRALKTSRSSLRLHVHTSVG